MKKFCKFDGLSPARFFSTRAARSDQPRRRLAGDGFTQTPQEFFFTQAPPFFTIDASRFFTASVSELQQHDKILAGDARLNSALLPQAAISLARQSQFRPAQAGFRSSRRREFRFSHRSGLTPSFGFLSPSATLWSRCRSGLSMSFLFRTGGYAAGAAPRPGYVLSPSRALNFVRYRSVFWWGMKRNCRLAPTAKWWPLVAEWRLGGHSPAEL